MCTYTNETTKILLGRALPCSLQLSSDHILLAHSSQLQQTIAPNVSGDFDTFLTTLPAWEYQLLHNLSLKFNIFTTVQDFNNKEATLYAVSDGSTPIFIGSFGWVMQTKTGIYLAENNGPAPGFHTTSFCAEAYEVLSILFFLLRAFQYTMLPQAPKIILCMDLQSVLWKYIESQILRLVQYLNSYVVSGVCIECD